MEKGEARYRPRFAASNATPNQGETDDEDSQRQVWVHDQDEALAFYRDKLGMEVRADATLPEMEGFAGSPSGHPARTTSRSCSWPSPASR